MARIGVKALVGQFSKYADAVPTLDWLFAQINNAINGQLDATNLADSAVTTTKITDLAVTAAKIALGTITQSQIADGVGFTASGNYAGDGTTANRIIAVAFTARSVEVIRTDGTFIEFRSIQDGGTTTNWYRDTAGAQAALATNWQGIVANGFKLGTSAVGTSNAAGVTYRWTAWK